MKCVPFAVNVCICEMLFLAYTEHTSTMSPELMKLRVMTISTKTKVPIIFGTSAMCVELRAKKCALSSNVCTCEMLILTCTEHTSTLSPVNEAQDYDY